MTLFRVSQTGQIFKSCAMAYSQCWLDIGAILKEQYPDAGDKVKGFPEALASRWALGKDSEDPSQVIDSARLLAADRRSGRHRLGSDVGRSRRGRRRNRVRWRRYRSRSHCSLVSDHDAAALDLEVPRLLARDDGRRVSDVVAVEVVDGRAGLGSSAKRITSKLLTQVMPGML